MSEHQPAGSIDEIDFVDGLPNLVRHRAPLVVPADAPISVRGWALEAGHGQVAERLKIQVGPSEIEREFRLERPDIADAFKSASLARCGFTAGIPTTGLVPGQYKLKALLRPQRSSSWLFFASRVIFIASLLDQNVPRAAPEMSATLEGAIDLVEDHDRHHLSQPGPVERVTMNSGIVIRGWAFETEATILEIRARIGQVGIVRGTVGLARPDLRQHFATTDAALAGFIVPIRLDGIPCGQHDIVIELRTRRGWAALLQSHQLRIVPAHDDFPAAARELAESVAVTFDRGRTTVELGDPVRIRGTIGEKPPVGCYLEIVSCEGSLGAGAPLRLQIDPPIANEKHVNRFAVDVPPHVLARGRYTAALLVPTADRRGFRRSQDRIDVEVIAPRGGQRSAGGHVKPAAARSASGLSQPGKAIAHPAGLIGRETA